MHVLARPLSLMLAGMGLAYLSVLGLHRLRSAPFLAPALLSRPLGHVLAVAVVGFPCCLVTSTSLGLLGGHCSRRDCLLHLVSEHVVRAVLLEKRSKTLQTANWPAVSWPNLGTPTLMNNEVLADGWLA